MKNLFFLLALLAFRSTMAQISNDGILKAFINEPDFCKYVIPSCERCDTIKLVDTLNYFLTKKPLAVQGRVVTVSSDYIIGHPMPNNANDLRKWSCSNLFVTINRDKPRRYILHYYHTPTNGVGFIEFKRKRSRLRKVKSQFGQL